MTKKKRKYQSFRERFQLHDKQNENDRMVFEAALELALKKDVPPSNEELCYLEIERKKR